MKRSLSEANVADESCTKASHVDAGVAAADRIRLRTLFSEGRLLHPLGASASSQTSSASSFTDLAHGISLCCGVSPENGVREKQAKELAEELGGQQRKHIVVVLCDGMGTNILEQHLRPTSFLRSRNKPNRLVAVFPATTPAALTTLATGVWPGQHGQPGWDLRDQKGCDFPGKPAKGPVQIRVLHSYLADMRTQKPITEFGFEDMDIFVAAPWTSVGSSSRRMRFINAYNGTDFTKWYQGPHSGEVQLIPETAAETLGTPEGSESAIGYFHTAVDGVIKSLRDADEGGWSSYIYLYTAHPDKHMHALGIEHDEVGRVMRGLDKEVARLWTAVRDLDVSLLVTADHGHVSVKPSDMVTLPDSLLELLEYASVGVHGKGRHAVLHCRCGLQQNFERRWAMHPQLCEAFLLLTVEAAAEEGLFGPDAPLPEVRPRLGDYIAIAIGSHTLVSPDEAAKFRDGPNCKCQGSHGTLSSEEMRIPFVLCTPAKSGD